MDDEVKNQARELLIKSKVYRILANVFAIVGAVIFAIIFFKYYGDDVAQALRDPMTIFLIIFPFSPAIFLSLKAKRADKALHKLLSSEE